MSKAGTTVQSINKKQKPKMKKNANEFVDIQCEKQLDPKYKTEMCKSWLQTNFCVYGNKCRFAHGSNELFSRSLNTNNYKQKDCKSFVENGFCMYGIRCNFRHSEVKLKELERSYFTYLLKCFSGEKLKEIDDNNYNFYSGYPYMIMRNNTCNLNGNLKNFLTFPNFSYGATNNFNYQQTSNSANPLKKYTFNQSKPRRLKVFEQMARKNMNTFSDKSTENNSENENESEIEIENEIEGSSTVSSSCSNEYDCREKISFNTNITNNFYANHFIGYNPPFLYHADNRYRSPLQL